MIWKSTLRGGLIAAALAAGLPTAVGAGPGSVDEPVRYVGQEQVDATHEGGLRWAVGVKNWQAFRANRAHPEKSDGLGWTYNHAPMLCYWHGRFWLEYLSGPMHENKGPIHTLLLSSADGITWDAPREVFPVYTLPDGTPAQMHQRMGFYVAPDGRLLVLGFYGVPTHPNDGRGVGRVGREVRSDGSLGPIYFLRYSAHNGWSTANTTLPFFSASPDAGFVQACRALLADRLMTLQWWEEDRATDGFYPDLGGTTLKALSYYHRKDGAVVGLWKSSWAALSSDEGRSWSRPVRVPTLAMAEAKVWGQRTPDGRYLLAYNPRRDNRHRWPLAVVTGEDGVSFDELLTVQGEVPPRRYNGLDKAFGPQYVRGIAEGNGTPPGDAVWITYSMNKEDLWVSRIPVPVRAAVTAPVQDTFDQGALAELPWNLHSPRLAPVGLADFPSAANRSLVLRDADPADYARAVRIFPATKRAVVRFKVLARQSGHGRLEIELHDRHGYRPPIRLFFDDQGRVLGMNADEMERVTLLRYQPDTWYEFAIRFDQATERFDVEIDGRAVMQGVEWLEAVDSLERISFRTGEFRERPTLRDPKTPGEDFPGADEPVPEAVFHVDDVRVEPLDAGGVRRR